MNQNATAPNPHTTNPFLAPPKLDLLCIGEVMLELSCHGNFKNAEVFSSTYAGDTFNTAVAVSRLGSQVGYVTRVGQDPFADGLISMFDQEGINTAYVRPCPGYTGVYFLAVDNNGSREFIYHRKGSAASHLSEDDINSRMIQNTSAVYASGISLALSPGALKATVKAFKLAKEAGVLTAFDINYRKELWKGREEAFDAIHQILPYVDVILPSWPEDIAALFTFRNPEQAIEYFWCHGVPLVILKAGVKGAYLGFRRQIQYVPAMDVHVVDTTAAGDAFNGGFLHGLITGHSLVDCARLGNTTAGLKIQQYGTTSSLPYRDEVYNTTFSGQLIGSSSSASSSSSGSNSARNAIKQAAVSVS